MIPTVHFLSGNTPAVLDKYRAKFIVVEREGEHFLFADDTAQWHSDVFQSFCKHVRTHGVDVPEKHYFPQSGGKIEIMDGRIRAYGESQGYGRFAIEQVHALLEPFAKERELSLVVE